MSVFTVNTKITPTFLRTEGFQVSHWGSPHNWSPKNKFYEGSKTFKDKFGLEHEWVLYYFPHGFDAYCRLDYKRVYPDRVIWANLRELTIVSDELKTEADYRMFLEQLAKRTKKL